MRPRRRYTMRPRRRYIAITDAGLRCFVQWARLNSEEIVLDPIVARRVLQAYAGIPDALNDPGLALANRLAAEQADTA